MKRNTAFARGLTAQLCMLLLVLVAGAKAATYSILTSFNGGNGYFAHQTPLVDSSGNVFSATEEGGSNGCGVVFELVNHGGGIYTNTPLYNFTCLDDGGYPYGGVVEDASGNLYGVASEYGAYGAGVIYELVNEGGGTYSYEVIYTFTGATDGNFPEGDLVWHDGSLYGVTDEGGGGDCEPGCGVVFRLTNTGSGWTETVLHTFSYFTGDGYYPEAGLTFDSKGNIYGTTEGGGSYGSGIVYRLSPLTGFHGPGVTYDETILHNFDGAADGCDLESGVILDKAGNLYGTAAYCGVNYDGTVYQLKRSGGKYEFNVLLQFDYTNGQDSADWTGHLAIDSSGNVYGTAARGGAYDYGLVFQLAAGTWAFTDLHDFDDNGTDGYEPYGGVSLDSHGNLYGTTTYGGTSNDGTVWQITAP